MSQPASRAEHTGSSRFARNDIRYNVHNQLALQPSIAQPLARLPAMSWQPPQAGWSGPASNLNDPRPVFLATRPNAAKKKNFKLHATAYDFIPQPERQYGEHWTHQMIKSIRRKAQREKEERLRRQNWAEEQRRLRIEALPLDFSDLNFDDGSQSVATYNPFPSLGNADNADVERIVFLERSDYCPVCRSNGRHVSSMYNCVKPNEAEDKLFRYIFM